MAEGPRPIVVGAFGGGSVRRDDLPLSQLLGIDEVVGHQNFGIDFVLEVLGGGPGEDVEGLLRFGELPAPLGARGGFVFSGAGTDHLGDLVEQRHVADGERGPGRPFERGTVVVGPPGGGRADCRWRSQQVGEDALGFESGPEGQDGAHNIFVGTHLVADVGDLRTRQDL